MSRSLQYVLPIALILVAASTSSYIAAPDVLLLLAFLVSYSMFSPKPAIVAGGMGLALRLCLRSRIVGTPALMTELLVCLCGAIVIVLCLRRASLGPTSHRQNEREKALEASEESLRLVIDTMPALVWCANADGGPAFLNKRMAEFCGVNPSDTIQPVSASSAPSEVAVDRWRRMLHPDDYDGAYQTWWNSLVTGQPYYSIHRMRRVDGTFRWFQSMGEPIRDERGRILRWYGFNVDIDDAKHNEVELTEARDRLARAMHLATVGELSASVAHEINQPLSAIVANAQACRHWLESSPPNLQRVSLTVDRILRDCQATADIVSRIRALFKRAEVVRGKFDINEVIEEVILLVRDRLRLKDIKLQTALAPSLPQVVVDRVQIQQLVMNLMLNAIDAMSVHHESSHELELMTHSGQSGAIIVSVRDTGHGISDTDKIFEPFFTTKERGMGMGLSICRSIAEQHGGQLLASRNTERGSTFSFTVPVADHYDA